MQLGKIPVYGRGSIKDGNILLPGKRMNKPLLSIFKSIAVIQTAFIGDVALALPLAAKIKQINRDCRLTFITTPQASEIPSSLADINNVIIFDKRKKHNGIKGLIKFKREIEDNNFDCIISPHRSLRTSILIKLLNPKISVSFNSSSLSFLYSKRVKYKIHLHEKERNLSLLSVFSDYDNNFNLNPELNLKFKLSDIDYVNNFINYNNLEENNYILIAPGSVWETKIWCEKHFSELVNQIESINIKCVLIGSQSDYELCSRIAMKCNAINLAGCTNISQTILMMMKARMTISNDSGPIHFAGLVKCPTIAIFGPTSPIFGFAPTGINDIIIENIHLNCRPCAIHGSKACPIKTHVCMKSIKPEEVFKAIKNYDL